MFSPFREQDLEDALDGGLGALPPYYDKNRPVDVAEAFGQLVGRSGYLDRVPQLKASLGRPAATGVIQEPDRPERDGDEDEDTPGIPPTEPTPAPVEDPPDAPGTRGPYVVRRRGAPEP